MKAAFVLQQDPAVWWPVTVKVPAAGGKVEDFQFEALVRVLPEEAYPRLIPSPEKIAEEDKDAPSNERLLRQLARNAEILPQLIRDWRGPTDAGGPIAFARLPELLKGPYGRPLSVGLYAAVHEVRYGMPAKDIESASLGNSAAPSATG